MRVAEFVKEIQGPGRRPVYVVSGGEPGGVAKCLAAAAAAVNAEFFDFNFQKIDLDDGGTGRLLGEAATLPFFAPPRVIVTRNPALKAEDLVRLADYLAAPNPDTTLLLVVDKPDFRLKFFKRLKELGGEVDCRPPKGAELIAWLADEFKDRRVSAAPAALRLLVERAGEDPGVLAGEVEKLSLYLGEGHKLEPALVNRLVGLSPSANIFALGEALGEQDQPRATATLLELLATEHPLPVLAMMVRHFRILLQIKTRLAASGGRLDESAAKDLGLHPYALTKNLPQARRWSWRALREALAALETAHRTLVTSPAPGPLVLENLALKLGSASLM